MEIFQNRHDEINANLRLKAKVDLLVKADMQIRAITAYAAELCSCDCQALEKVSFGEKTVSSTSEGLSYITPSSHVSIGTLDNQAYPTCDGITNLLVDMVSNSAVVIDLPAEGWPKFIKDVQTVVYDAERAARSKEVEPESVTIPLNGIVDLQLDITPSTTSAYLGFSKKEYRARKRIHLQQQLRQERVDNQNTLQSRLFERVADPAGIIHNHLMDKKVASAAEGRTVGEVIMPGKTHYKQVIRNTLPKKGWTIVDRTQDQKELAEVFGIHEKGENALRYIFRPAEENGDLNVVLTVETDEDRLVIRSYLKRYLIKKAVEANEIKTKVLSTARQLVNQQLNSTSGLKCGDVHDFTPRTMLQHAYDHEGIPRDNTTIRSLERDMLKFLADSLGQGRADIALVIGRDVPESLISVTKTHHSKSGHTERWDISYENEVYEDRPQVIVKRKIIS